MEGLLRLVVFALYLKRALVQELRQGDKYILRVNPVIPHLSCSSVVILMERSSFCAYDGISRIN